MGIKMQLSHLNAEDLQICNRISALHDAMLARTLAWSADNTGSYNTAGLNAFAPKLIAALGALEADVKTHASDPFERIDAKGQAQTIQTGPVITATTRPDAPVQIVMTGHYDTVFPKGSFEKITQLEDGRINGPGLADMKGGLSLMIGAMTAFEAGPLKDKIGYRIVITPDEEIGNFASVPFLMAAAKDAHIGMTYEPAMESGAMSGGRKGSAIYDMVLHGKATHAGRDKEGGRSALLAAALATQKLEALNNPTTGLSVNVGKIDGGNAVNIVPDLAIVRFGVRAPDEAVATQADATIKAIFAETIARDGISGHIHGGFYRPPKPRNTAQAVLFDAVAETGKGIGLNLDFQDTGGVCEGNNVFAAGVPNVDTLGVVGGRIHSTDEYFWPDSLTERAQLSGLLLNRLADGRMDAAAIKALMD